MKTNDFTLLACIPIASGVKPEAWEQEEMRSDKCERCACLIWSSKLKRDHRLYNPSASLIVCFECAVKIQKTGRVK